MKKELSVNGWFAYITLTITMFIIYYTFLYPALSYSYDQHFWHVESHAGYGQDFDIALRMPKYVASFEDSEIGITITRSANITLVPATVEPTDTPLAVTEEVENTEETAPSEPTDTPLAVTEEVENTEETAPSASNSTPLAVSEELNSTNPRISPTKEVDEELIVFLLNGELRVGDNTPEASLFTKDKDLFIRNKNYSNQAQITFNLVPGESNVVKIWTHIANPYTGENVVIFSIKDITYRLYGDNSSVKWSAPEKSDGCESSESPIKINKQESKQFCASVNSWAVFRRIIIDTLLIPPFSNVFIPALIFALILLSENILSQQCEKSDSLLLSQVAKIFAIALVFVISMIFVVVFVFIKSLGILVSFLILLLSFAVPFILKKALEIKATQKIKELHRKLGKVFEEYDQVAGGVIRDEWDKIKNEKGEKFILGELIIKLKTKRYLEKRWWWQIINIFRPRPEKLEKLLEEIRERHEALDKQKERTDKPTDNLPKNGDVPTLNDTNSPLDPLSDDTPHKPDSQKDTDHTEEDNPPSTS